MQETSSVIYNGVNGIYCAQYYCSILYVFVNVRGCLHESGYSPDNGADLFD